MTKPRAAIVLLSGWVLIASGCTEKNPADRHRDGDGASRDQLSGASNPPLAKQPSRRRLVLGRIVDIQAMKALGDGTELAPEREANSPDLDVGVVSDSDQIRGFRLSTGALLWSHTPGNCTDLLFAAGTLYTVCSSTLSAFDPRTGTAAAVSAGQDIEAVAISGRYLAALRTETQPQGGSPAIAVFDAEANAPVTSKSSNELAPLRGTVRQFLLPRPGAVGFCILGVASDPLRERARGRRAPRYRAGCYDQSLTSVWVKDLPAGSGDASAFDVRQLGPEILVLDDQTMPLNAGPGPNTGRGLMMSWRTGSIEVFDDRTFGVIADRAGTRVREPPVLTTFARVAALTESPTSTKVRTASVVTDAGGEKSFALITNRAVALAGFNLVTRQPLFLVPIKVAGADQTSLEVEDGLVAVRSRYNDHWRITIHDSTTGAVRYQDRRMSSDPYH